MTRTPADLLEQLRIERHPEATASPRRHGRWIAAALAVVVLASAVGWPFIAPAPAIEVRTAPVLAISAGGNAASVLDASGYVVARRMATVSAKITGKVREVMIEEGMRVEQGQVMATLDPLDADAQLRLADSQLAAAHSQVDNIHAQLRSAEADASRMQTLVAQQLVSRSEYDNAVSTRDALRAQLQNAQRNVKVYGDQLAIARIDMDNTIVRAPFTGIITAKAAQPGEIVSPLATGGYTRTGIGTLVDMDSLEIEVEVGEAFIGRVQPKMPVEAILNAYPEWKIPAEVIAIIPTADRAKATVKVRVALLSKDARIVPEMGVRVSFLEQASARQQTPQGVRVPQAALTEREGATVAFALQPGNRVALRGDSRQALAGLLAGDVVVLDPPAQLRDGEKVSLLDGQTP
jgi:RND family efflux transporter MFP subunit